MKQFISVVIFSILIIACSNEKDEEVIIENPAIIETDAPIINVSSIPNIIEVLTSLQIRITDETTISSQIIINGELILESQNKNIEFTIDPFDYKIGDKILEIISIDANGNESNLKIEFELKKLLFNDQDPEIIGNDVFLAVNYSDGQLYMSRKIEGAEDGKFYADDTFVWQAFTITKYRIFINEDNPIKGIIIYSYAEMEPGTQLLTYDEQLNLFNLGNLPSNESQLIEINDVESPLIFGYNGSMNRFDTGFNPYLFSYNLEEISDFFMYSMPNWGNLITDYKYVIITDLTKSSYSINDFSPASNFMDIELPEYSPYSIGLRGYKDAADYSLNKFKHVYSYSDFSQTITNRTVTIPIIDEVFEIYVLNYTSYINEKKASYSQTKLNNPITIKSINIEKNGENITFSGDYDFSKLQFGYVHPVTNSNGYFRWDFHYKNLNMIKIPFNDFEIPGEVQLIFDEKGFITKPSLMTTLYSLDAEIYDYEQIIEYNNLLFGQNYNQNEAGDVHGMKLNLID